MVTGIIVAVWIFGVCAILYGSTLLYWAWHSPEDADAAKRWIVIGLPLLNLAMAIIQ